MSSYTYLYIPLIYLAKKLIDVNPVLMVYIKLRHNETSYQKYFFFQLNRLNRKNAKVHKIYS